jgi:hypothetical protein
MNSDEINNLMQVMSNKINQLTQQNIMLESRVIYLSSIIEKLQSSEQEQNDGGTFDETQTVKQNNVKTKQQGTT